MNIEKLSNLSPANFSSSLDKSSYQTNLIVGLLQKSIETQSPITKDDIARLYGTYKLHKDKKLEKQIYLGYNGGDYRLQYRYEEIEMEEYIQQWEVRRTSFNWFKSNLGSAIIKGRILAIPIIEL